ncbi:unnamed protein product, partial [Effrenium voratum]
AKWDWSTWKGDGAEAEGEAGRRASQGNGKRLKKTSASSGESQRRTRSPRRNGRNGRRDPRSR